MTVTTDVLPDPLKAFDFRKLFQFAFFDRYPWSLDDQQRAGTRSIDPDAIGDLFEKDVNRRQTGTYYTQDDITETIARSTIIPFLLDRVAARCPDAFRPDGVWRLLRAAPDRYLFAALRHGADLPLPSEAADRDASNRPAPATHALPTETWRECLARHGRCRAARDRLRAGEVASVNDLVTDNLDLVQFTLDVLAASDGPDLPRAFEEALGDMRVLDPTCGTGAFLIAALAVLEPLYAAVRERTGEPPDHRPSLRAAIVANNLYGVDLMPEAVEICKHRLLLRVAQEQDIDDLESPSNLTFNVRVGNALVGLVEERDNPRPFHWESEFNDVMARGGFDVIVGNPPYVEYAQVRNDYRLLPHATEDCGNLYAAVVERSFALLRPDGRMGMIVPHSAFCTDRMAPLMRLFDGPRATWVSTYDIRPAKLFAGVDQRLAIFLTAPAAQRQIFATRYHRWHEAARPALFPTLAYADVSDVPYPNAIAKVGTATELRLLEKLSRRTPLAVDLRGPATVYYHNAPRYWVRAMTFAPYFRNERDGEKRSAQVKTLPVRSPTDAAAAAAALNSSLFYWWFVAFSDSRHLNRREIGRFPLDLAGLSDADRRELADLCSQLMDNYCQHAVRKECHYKTTGRVVYDEYYPRHAKAILDAVDRVLARHLGLAADECDFVINYDMKYRFGEEGGP